MNIAPTLEDVIVSVIPVQDVKSTEDILPCEEGLVDVPNNIDFKWLKRFEDKFGHKLKYLHPEILKKNKEYTVTFPDNPSLKIGLPVYAFIDPFKRVEEGTYIHNGTDTGKLTGRLSLKANTSVEFETNLSHFFQPSFKNYTPFFNLFDDLSIKSNIIVGSIIVLASVLFMFFLSYSFTSLLVGISVGSVGLINILSNVYRLTQNTLYKDVYAKFEFITRIPGLIPKDVKNKLKELRDFADQSDYDRRESCKLRLIVEADWKLQQSEILPKDPVIVLIKDNMIFYVDRFDCTTLETSLAQGYTTPL